MTFSLANTGKKINNLETDSDEYFDTDFGKWRKGKKRNPNIESPKGCPNHKSSRSLIQCTQAKNIDEVLESPVDIDDYKEGDDKLESYEFVETEQSSPQIKRNRIGTFYTANAPRELINLLYKLGQEAKKRNKFNFKYLPDDLPIPSPLPWDCSIGSFGSLTGSSSDFYTTRTNIVSSYSLLNGSFLSNWLSLERIDGSFRQSLPSMDNRKWHSDSSSYKDKESVSEIRLMDVHSSSSGELKRDEFSDDGRSLRDQAISMPAEKAVGKLQKRDFYPKKHKKMRSNSTDFAFSEANEASRIEMSAVTSPKAAKEFLIPEERKEKEDDVESIIMHIMKNHLRCGRRRKIISQSMLKKNVKLNEERRHRINRILWKPLMALERQRHAAKQDDQKPIPNKSRPRLNSRRAAIDRISVIDEEDQASSLSLIFDKE